jgi:hypothetical protein
METVFDHIQKDKAGRSEIKNPAPPTIPLKYEIMQKSMENSLQLVANDYLCL